jgi:hypothetical protein
LDEAIGGTRWQTFDEQLSEARDNLRNSANVDHDEHGALLEKYNALEDAKHAAEQEAIANGVDPATFKVANAKWAKGSALLDLQKHIQESATGLRPELHQPGTNAAPETISPGKLAPRANRLYNSGRLAQALNQNNAEDLILAVETAAQREKQVTASNARLATILKTTGKTVGVGAGLGAAGALGYDATKQ